MSEATEEKLSDGTVKNSFCFDFKKDAEIHKNEKSNDGEFK